MKIGYARVSTQDQSLEAQEVLLKEQGCEIIFKEYISGASTDRPEFQKMLSKLRRGDAVVVSKLDRMGRSMIDLIQTVESFEKEGIDFISLGDNFDTSTPNGGSVISTLSE